MFRSFVRRRGAPIGLVALLGVLASGGPAAALPPKPLFQLPFPCGQSWSLFSYSTHNPNDKKIDMQRADGTTRGSPVVASYAGVVHSFGDPGGIEIDHGGGWFSLYLHMPTRTVSVGQRVAQGQRGCRIQHGRQRRAVISGDQPELRRHR
jgi:hypothetical protein